MVVRRALRDLELIFWHTEVSREALPHALDDLLRDLGELLYAQLTELLEQLNSYKQYPT